MAAATADLIVRVVTDTSKAKGLDETAAKGSKFSRGLATASKVAAGALVAVGGAAISAAKAAAEDQASQDALAKSMQRNAGATSAQISATEDWISKMSMATGVADDELRPALSTLVRATGDVQKSQKALAVAMDVSAATGRPLEAVSNAMAKGFAGSTTSLGRLVPGLSKAALESGNMGRVMDELKAKTGGAAKAAGETAAGKMKRFQLALSETQEAAGAALLPAMTKLADILLKVGNWAQKHGTMFTVIAAGVAVLAAAIIALNVAMTVYTSVTTLAAAASEAAWIAALGPIGLVIVAVLAVVAVVVILWKKSETFRKIVLAVWAAIRTAARATASFLKAAFQVALSLVTAYFRAYKAVVMAVLKAIKTAIRAAAEVIKTVFRGARDVVRAVFDAIRSKAADIGNRIRDIFRNTVVALKQMWQGARDVIRAVFDAVRDKAGDIAGRVREMFANAVGGVKTTFNSLKTVVGELFAKVTGAGSTLAGPFNTMKSAVNNVIGAVKSLISWVGSLINKIAGIHFPSVPKGLSGIIGKLTGRSAPVPSGFGAGVRSFAPAPTGFARGVGTHVATRGGGGAGVVININGAIDPEGVARQLRAILGGHDRRVGVRAVGA